VFDKILVEQKCLKSDLETDGESLMRTVCGSEYQTDGAENRKARLEKSVLMNGWSSSGMADERRGRLQARFAEWFTHNIKRFNVRTVRQRGHARFTESCLEQFMRIPNRNVLLLLP